MSEVITDNESFDEALQHTELGNSLSKHKPLVIVIGVLTLIAISGYSIFNYISNKNHQEALEAIYNFKTQKIVTLKNKKITADDFLQSFYGLPVEILKDGSFYSEAKEAVNVLREQKEGEKAIRVIEKMIEVNELNVYTHILRLDLAAYYENQGQNAKAITTLEQLLNVKVKFAQDRLYYDLARLYKLEGDNAKAKSNLEYLKKTFPESSLLPNANELLRSL